MIPRLFAVLLLALALGTPCVASETAPARITVFAAASLQESLDQAARRWMRRSGQEVVVSYAASSALARQIEQGAPADVFISADGEWMDYLEQRDLIAPATRFDVVGNAMVVVVPVGSPVRSLSLDTPATLIAALGDGGRLAMAETTAVPAGRYARAALARRGLWPAVQDRLAQGDSVRGALAFVARGEAPVGIVYATDALAEPRVRVVARFDRSDHPAIRYPAARVAASATPQVDGFLAFLRSAEMQDVFKRAGFSIP
ncbi:molybdate ABC transporter substrate-binding protein [Arenimonas sp. MALMAid1274]|uniref:molybdate ABC transporter substrate-binding protein n=1 Tax=Arenimonas sp. MALMAid1274 TaxID=3411630 RepID=UPI003B9EE8B9